MLSPSSSFCLLSGTERPAEIETKWHRLLLLPEHTLVRGNVMNVCADSAAAASSSC